MRDRLAQHLAKTRLLEGAKLVLVAYSGGADSTCLLHLLKELGVPVVAAHLHHGLRPEADHEADLCAKACEDWGIDIVTGKANVAQIAAEQKIGLEEAGREARLAFLQQAALQLGATLIATGHTLDDQVETVLFRLARGTGLAGLAGIPEQRNNLVRPLLPFRRAETRGYCQDLGLWFHDDPANEDLHFSRSRLRLRVVPELELVHPGAVEAIARLARLAGEEDDFIDQVAANAIQDKEIALNGPLRFLTATQEAAFSIDAFRTLPLVLIRRALRLVLSYLGAEPGLEWTEDLWDGVHHQPQGSRTAPGGAVIAEWEDGVLHLRQAQTEEVSRYPLPIPGDLESDHFGWALRVSEATPEAFAAHSLECVIDRNKVQGNLSIRSSQEGDRFEPLGLGGTKTLGDLFRDRGLTLIARRRLPIICDMVGIVWVPGCAVAERVKTDANTLAKLRVLFEPLMD